MRLGASELRNTGSILREIEHSARFNDQAFARRYESTQESKCSIEC